MSFFDCIICGNVYSMIQVILSNLSGKDTNVFVIIFLKKIIFNPTHIRDMYVLGLNLDRS